MSLPTVISERKIKEKRKTKNGRIGRKRQVTMKKSFALSWWSVK